MIDRKEYNKQYYQKNKEKKLARSKMWAKDNREKSNAIKNKWRRNNREQALEIIKQWHKKNSEKEKEYWKKYFQKNKEKLYKKIKEWNKTENGKALHQRSNHKRRTREKEIINTLTAKEWADILEEHNYRCIYCDVEFNCELLPTKDHIIPINKGGHNTKENIVPACRSCNSKKHDKLDYKPEVMVI